MTDLERFFERLVRNLAAIDQQKVKQPIPVATVTATDAGESAVVAAAPAVAAKPTNIVMPGDSTRARRSRRYRGARLY